MLEFSVEEIQEVGERIPVSPSSTLLLVNKIESNLNLQKYIRFSQFLKLW
jgi:hypothetical protein